MKKYLKACFVAALACTLMFVFTTNVTPEVEQSRPQKIDSALWEYMQSADDDGLIPINIVLSSVDDNALMEKVKIKTGMDPAVYMDEERFQSEVVSKVTAVLEKNLGYDEAHRVENDSVSKSKSLSKESKSAICSVFSNELKEFGVDAERIIEFLESDNSLSIVDYTILEIRQNFQSEKNKVIKEEQSAVNDLFISAYVNERNNDVMYASRYTSSLYLNAKKGDIIYYSQKSEVMSIYYIDPELNEIEPM